MGTFFRLVDFECNEKKINFLSALKDCNKNIYFNKNLKEFNKIPGCNFDYWISTDMVKNFDHLLSSCLNCKTGLICGNNEKFIRYWFEVDINKILFGCKSLSETYNFNYSWAPYNHGGDKRRWYGSHFDIVYCKNGFCAIKNEKNAMLRNSDFYFKRGITWNRVGSGVKFAARIAEQGFVFDDVSPSGFCQLDDLNFILAYMNSKVFNSYLRLFSNGFKVEIGHISSIPYKILNDDEISKSASKCIEIEKDDWDSFEISNSFKKHPLV